MMAKKYFLFGCIVAMSAIFMIADDSTQQKWTRLQQAPTYVDGVRIYKPVIENGKMTYGDIVNISTSPSNDDAFVNALVCAINTINPETEAIESVDYDQHIFVVNRLLTTETGRTYEYAIAVEISNGILSFMVPDVTVRYKEKLFISRKTSFKKLNLEKKELHRQFVEEFSLLNSTFISQMAQAVDDKSTAKVTKWADVKKGKTIKGMNGTEVLLIEGKPDMITEAGEGIVKWMYGSNRIIIFNNGTVERVVNF